ncbi:MAG: HrgC protein [Gemmatimonadetes bacterium]|nr:HrgC protein [Gemmatimonadota bacterium]
MTQSQSGTVKQVKLGFSWTTLFFGLFVPLVRGDIKWAAIMFVLAFLSFGLSWLVFQFLYNKVHTRALLESGYAASTEEDRRRLQAAGLVLGET